MIIKTDKCLNEFEFWSGAEYHASKLSAEDFDMIEDALTEMHPDGMTETEINDLFWFEEDFIAECIGYDSWEDYEASFDRDEESEGM